MSLIPGTRLGPYEIQSALGAGGMGEVYRARDTRLNRIVAIKVDRGRQCELTDHDRAQLGRGAEAPGVDELSDDAIIESPIAGVHTDPRRWGTLSGEAHMSNYLI